MEITYENKVRDHFSFFLLHSRKEPVFIGMFIFFIAGSTFLTESYFPERITGAERVFLVAFLECLILTTSIFILAGVQVLSLLPKQNKGFLTRHTLTINDDFFIEETDYNRMEHKWPGIVKVIRNKKIILVYIGQHSAHVIPRRVVGSGEEWDALFNEINSRFQKKSD